MYSNRKREQVSQGCTEVAGQQMIGHQSLATPALARSSSESAYFITWEKSEWPMSSASFLTCPGFSGRYQVPNVLLRSWGSRSVFLDGTVPHPLVESSL
jgi:hypothetical protein